ncbi:MAG: hypothetical protein E7612_10130 [Ruminococcaceae bacterium]|nr:hypothetical protein [Oscillospiraceae bacterium]
MNGVESRKLILMIVFAVAVALVVWLIARAAKAAKKNAVSKQSVDKKSAALSSDIPSGPVIIIDYESGGGLFEDGKCGWLDIECEDGEKDTVKLNFNKKAPRTITVPLKAAKYRITYRTKSTAAMAASNVLKAINENNGTMGAFANAVYDAGGMSGLLDSVVVDVSEDFVLRLVCETDGLTKSCRVVS